MIEKFDTTFKKCHSTWVNFHLSYLFVASVFHNFSEQSAPTRRILCRDCKLMDMERCKQATNEIVFTRDKWLLE